MQISHLVTQYKENKTNTSDSRLEIGLFNKQQRQLPEVVVVTTFKVEIRCADLALHKSCHWSC